MQNQCCTCGDHHLFSLAFSAALLRRYLTRGADRTCWSGRSVCWCTRRHVTEAFTSVVGWHEGIFRAWYISGALLAARR